MERTGVADLPLHHGKAPRWLVNRMIKLARCISIFMVDEFGVKGFLSRLSDPFWFQALGCVLGYDWHSSGVTTVLTGVLKRAIDPEETGLAVCGGKGKASLKTLSEIDDVASVFNLSTEKVGRLKYASRISAKVDNAMVQDGYTLYHHAFILSEDGGWAVIQQGMNVDDRTARRYHWLSDKVEDFIVEPHNAIVGDVKRRRAIDMTARESEGCRRISVEIVKENPKKIANLLKSIRPAYQRSMEEWITTCRGIKNAETARCRVEIEYLSMPSTLNWKALKEAYELQPRNYEELIGLRGIGPSTIRGLALISDLIYGEKLCWRDPVKYSFAFGGKDGVPYPVRRDVMDEAIKVLEDAIREARVGYREKAKSLRRLRSLISSGLRRHPKN